MTKKKTFLLYTDSSAFFEALSLEERGLLITAIFNYVNGQEIPPMDKTVNMAFRYISRYIAENNAKHQATCDKYRENANKRWQSIQSNTIECNGIQSNAMAYNGIQSNATECEAMRFRYDNDYEYDTEYDTDTDTDYDYDNEYEKDTKGKQNNKTYSAFEPLNKAITEYVIMLNEEGYPADEESIEKTINAVRSQFDTMSDQIAVYEKATANKWELVENEL